MTMYRAVFIESRDGEKGGFFLRTSLDYTGV